MNAARRGAAHALVLVATLVAGLVLAAGCGHVHTPAHLPTLQVSFVKVCGPGSHTFTAGCQGYGGAS